MPTTTMEALATCTRGVSSPSQFNLTTFPATFSGRDVDVLALEVSGLGEEMGTHAVWIERYLTATSARLTYQRNRGRGQADG
jgi:hypothetical protein